MKSDVIFTRGDLQRIKKCVANARITAQKDNEANPLLKDTVIKELDTALRMLLTKGRDHEPTPDTDA